MDEKTTIKELKNKVKTFCEVRDWNQFHDAKELAIALSIEASELLEHFRWKNKKEIKEKIINQKNEIEHEIADIFFFLLRICQMYDIDLSKSFDNKIKINEEKYSVEKAKGSNKKYNEF